MHIKSLSVPIVTQPFKILSRWTISRLNLLIIIMTMRIRQSCTIFNWKIGQYYQKRKTNVSCQYTLVQVGQAIPVFQKRKIDDIYPCFTLLILCLLICYYRQRCINFLTRGSNAFIYVHQRIYENFIAPIDGLLRCRHCSFVYIYISRISCQQQQ